LFFKEEHMTTILVTGGAGYIGTHTDVELLNKGYDVVCVDNYSNSSPKALDRVEEITGKTVKRYEGDVRDEALMDRIFTENDIDWVIHFASLKSVGESVAKPIEYYDNNLNSTIVLLKAMRAHDVKKVIFSSSATVYGTPKELPLTEESQTGGTTNPYGTPTQIEEQILRDPRLTGNYQIVLTREGHLDNVEVRCEVQRELSGKLSRANVEEISRSLQYHIKTIIGISTRIKVMDFDTIPRTQTGKARRVIDERPKQL